MGGFVCLCKAVRKRLERFENSESAGSCNCGWEIDTGYAIAYGLAVLEAKRLCLLAIGIFVEWNVLYFAGGLIPFVLTVVSVSFGVPTSLAAVFAIHKRRRQPCFPILKKILRLISGLVLFCAVLNVFAIASIAVYLNSSPEAMARVFNTSMLLYAEETWHKVTIDEFQFTFQCCGYTRYTDWTLFDWQNADYASREEMSGQPRISDEDLRPMAVPFSCCNIRNMMPCFHMDLSMMNRENSVNAAGCADVLSRLVLRSAILTYGVLTFLVLTQILLGLVIVKIAKRPLPSICPSVCDCTEKCPSVCPLIESSTSYLSSNGGCTSSSEQNSSRTKKRRGCGLSTISSRSSSSPSPPPTSNSRKSSLRNPSARTIRCCGGGCGLPAGAGPGAARIRPSLHTEHRVPKKRPCQKRAGLRPN